MIAPGAAAFLHRPVVALERAYGAPIAVSSRDDGQRFIFGAAGGTVTAIVDDDATVHALDVALPRGAAYAVTLEDAQPHAMIFGETTSAWARDALASDAETQTPTASVFRRSEDSAAVLEFDAVARTLSHVVVGDRAALWRMGLVPNPTPLAPPFPYVAPVLEHTAVAPGIGAQATVVRLDVDRLGIVRHVTVVLASADSAFDAAIANTLDDDTYRPATLGGRAIGASVYREVRH